MPIPSNIERPETYLESGFNSFLMRTNPYILDSPFGLPGEIAPASDLGQSGTNPELSETANNALQESADVIANAQNQITSISGNGVTVFSGASATSGARVVLNSAGLAAYDSGGTATFSLDASDGSAIFKGAISASTIDIGGADATSFHVDIDGNVWSGAATFATALFSVSNAGDVIAKSFMTDSTGTRVDLSGDDVVLYNSAGTKVIDIDANSGTSVNIIGTGDIDLSGGGNYKASGGGNYVMPDGSYIGFTASDSARIVWNDDTIDEIQVRDASFIIGGVNGADGSALVLDDADSMVPCLAMEETTTPTATSGFGKVYTKSDNKLYFQDGAGTEHEIAFV